MKEHDMPHFIDHHTTIADPPPEVMAEILGRLRSGVPDEFGERGINVFVGPAETYCHTEAPNADAVRKSHAALGIELGHEAIVEVQVLP